MEPLKLNQLVRRSIYILLILLSAKAGAQQYKDLQIIAAPPYLGSDINSSNSSSFHYGPITFDVITGIEHIHTKGQVKILIDHDYNKFVEDDYSIRILFDVQYKTSPTSPNFQINDIELDIEFYKDRKNYKDVAAYLFGNQFNVYSFEVKIKSIFDENHILISEAPDNVKLELLLQSYWNLEATDFSSVVSILPVDYSDNKFHFTWTTIDSASFYELEWMFVDNYGTPALSDIDFNFKYNSTRIQTRDPFYSINHVFEKGFLVYRARAVAIKEENGIDVLLPGPWSEPLNQGTLYQITGSYYQILSP